MINFVAVELPLITYFDKLGCKIFVINNVYNSTETAEELKAIAEQNTPHFIIRLNDTEVMERTFLRFMIKVNGEPRPKIQL